MQSAGNPSGKLKVFQNYYEQRNTQQFIKDLPVGRDFNLRQNGSEIITFCKF